jgi:hypothetical protein
MHPGAILTSLLSLAAAAGAWCWMVYERKGDDRARRAEAAEQQELLAAKDAERQTVLDQLKAEHKKDLEKLEGENASLRRQLADAIESAKPPPPPAEVAERVRAIRELAFARVPDWTPAPRSEILDRIAAGAVAGLTPQAAEARTRALVAMGFVTTEFDYRAAVVNLAQTKSGGYYDGSTGKFLFEAEASLARADSRQAFAGALLPVLIAQNFGTTAPPEPDNDDAALAARALAAGDASFYRVYFALNDQLRANNDRGQAPSPAPPPAAPQFLTEMWKWSEDSGNLFVQALHMKNGTAAINAAYSRPPRSSTEILHPELYQATPPFEPVRITFAEPAVNGLEPFFSNVAGEAASYFFVRGWADVDTAEVATRGWAGDRYLVWSGTKPHGDHILWRSEWTTEKDAEEFFAVMRTGLMSRHLIPWQKEYDAVAGQFRVDDPHRIIRLRRDGKTVTLLDATDPAFAKAAEEKFMTP